ncbi:MAG TPA: p-hydroxycinnamoyl-CoA synthetase, partial [Jiangellaceae bacterium]|nr:p-hydroxycinnamoyl-CoA synthetase [Jiangellaceae bacterium]
ETARVLREGWFHSGDAATVDDEGYLYIQDRYTDMIISGGENVYPAEVESALLELDGIVEAAVVAVPDETWGEVGMGVLVAQGEPPPSEQEVLDQLRTRLAGFKVPKTLRFVDELPKTATGKIRKNVLRGENP